MTAPEEQAGVPRLGALDRIWARHCSEHEWNFATSELHNGDVYFILSLMRFFRAYRRRPVRVIADSPGKFLLCRLYESDIEYGAFCEELSQVGREEFFAWASSQGRSAFETGSFLRLHPQDLSGGHFDISFIVYSKGLFNLVELFKAALHLPLSVSPTPPIISPGMAASGERLFQSYDLPEARTIVVFPYAQTLRFDAMNALRIFATLAKRDGFTVCTAVHGTEMPIEGTQPISIPFDLMLPFCDRAGNVVSVRSGIGEILSSSTARKSYLYNGDEFARFENPNAYGMCDCSNSILHEDAEATAAALLASLYLERFAGSPQFVPNMIIGYFVSIKENVLPTVFNNENGSRMGRYILFRHAVLGDGWSELEQWGIWGIGFRSVCYLLVPHEFRSRRDAVFLEIDLAVPQSSDFASLKISLELNGRRADVLLDGRAKVSVELTATEKAVGISRLIFDTREPNASPMIDRILSVGLIAARYCTERSSAARDVILH